MPKRLLDILLSLLALSVLLLPGLVIVILLKLTGEKEAFYFQPRVGRDKQLFTCWKLVTMRSGSEKTGTGAITIKNDPRVTPLGKFLRKTKINELPQLINVLKGDMSLVGPRPLTIEGFDFYSPDIQDVIAKVKPGLTGIGSIVFRDEEQLLGRTDKPYEQVYREDISPYKGALECWYVQHQSLALDLKILWYTNLVVLLPNGGFRERFLKGLPESMRRAAANPPTAPDREASPAEAEPATSVNAPTLQDNSRLLIIGGSGFIASYFYERLAARGIEAVNVLVIFSDFVRSFPQATSESVMLIHQSVGLVSLPEANSDRELIEEAMAERRSR